MMEQYDTDLHARVSILERDNARHESGIESLQKDEVDLKIFAKVCSNCFPALKEDITAIKNDIALLKQHNVRCDSLDEGNKNFWNTWRWLIEYLVFGAIVLFGSFVAFTMNYNLGLVK